MYKYFLAFFMLILIAVPSACSETTARGSSTTSAAYSSYEMAYKLLSAYPDYFWCDPDFYPVAREGQEQANALEQFATIQANSAEFTTIIKQAGLTEQATYSDEQKLRIYREHKKLTRALTLTPEGDHYAFIIRTGRNQGKLIEGTISSSGTIKVLNETNSFNTCPICLIRGTLIGTPSGDIPVEKLHPGMIIRSIDRFGLEIAVPILKTASTPVPPDFYVVRITLSDGRSVTASPGHPSSNYRLLGDYRVGDVLDGSLIIGFDFRAYNDEATFDLLPEGPTGLYYANGILLGSTLSPD
jgi:hypothetical protein